MDRTLVECRTVSGCFFTVETDFKQTSYSEMFGTRCPSSQRNNDTTTLLKCEGVTYKIESQAVDRAHFEQRLNDALRFCALMDEKPSGDSFWRFANGDTQAVTVSEP